MKKGEPEEEVVFVRTEKKRPAVISLVDESSDDEVVFVGSSSSSSRSRRTPPTTTTTTKEDEVVGKPPALKRPRREVTCPICFCPAAPSEAVRLGCGCAFCEECLETYVRGKVRDGEVTPERLSCPALLRKDKACGSPLAPREVHALLGDEAAVQRYDRLALQKTVEAEDDLACCPSPGCDYVFAFDAKHRKLDCPLCRKTYCLVCRAAPWHAGLRCEEYQARQKGGGAADEDEAFGRYAKHNKLKQCPQCRRWIEKTYGCDAMHCRCNLVFCYRCGGVSDRLRQGTGSSLVAQNVKQCRCHNVDGLLRAHENAANHNLRGN